MDSAELKHYTKRLRSRQRWVRQTLAALVVDLTGIQSLDDARQTVTQIFGGPDRLGPLSFDDLSRGLYAKAVQ